MPKSQTKREITVMHLGQQTDSNGVTRRFTTEEIDKAIEANNRIPFRVPIIYTHNSPDGVADHDVADHPKAMGIIGNFRRVGNAVKAQVIRGTEKLFKFIEDGVLSDRSVSLYTPQSSTNPSPGNYFFRHLAMLDSAPAIKGMPDMAEELGLSETIAAFSEDDPNDLVSVSCSESEPESANPADRDPAMTTVTRADLEELQANFMAKLESLLPKPPDGNADPEPEPERTDMTETKTKAKPEAPEKTVLAAEPLNLTQYTEQIADLQQKLDAANAEIVKLTPKPAPQPTAEELAQRAKTQKLEALIALQELDGLRSDVQTCISNNRERITPGLSNPVSVSYTERRYDEQAFEFSEESKSTEWQLAGFMERVARGKTDRSDYEGFKTWLSKLPKQVDLSERSVMENGDVDQPKTISAEELAEKARAFAEKKRSEGTQISYAEALDQVIAAESLAL